MAVTRISAVDDPGMDAAVRTVKGMTASRCATGRLVGGMLAVVLAVVASGAVRADEAAAWKPLFDGTTLGAWKPTPFGGEGEVRVADGAIVVPMGATLSGITWAGEFPRTGYEIELQARRVEGSDFFCGLTFPVGDSCCSLILGGWGGSVTGLSCLDGRDAADNETTDTRNFTRGHWYAVRVRVTPARIECLLDGEPLVEQNIEGRRISVRDEVAASQPLGIATYATTGEFRGIRWRPLPAETP
ncbi:MAG: DUF1080 domain-containing protein [Pirellulales bacterium]